MMENICEKAIELATNFYNGDLQRQIADYDIEIGGDIEVDVDADCMNDWEAWNIDVTNGVCSGYFIQTTLADKEQMIFELARDIEALRFDHMAGE